MIKAKKALKPIDSRSYTYWQALYLSFYSRPLYVDVGKRWKGLGILYLLLLVAVGCVPLAVKINWQFNTLFNTQIVEPLKKLPPLYIQRGEVIFDKPMPYMIKNTKGQDTIIIDTTGTITSFASYPQANILINKNTIYFRFFVQSLLDTSNNVGDKSVSTKQPLNENMNEVFDGKKLVEGKSVMLLKRFFQITLYPMIVSIIFTLLLLFLLFLTFLGQIYSRIFFSFALHFKAASRLLMVGATPMAFLLMFSLLSNIVFFGLGILLLLLLFAYYSFAIIALRAESKKLVV